MTIMSAWQRSCNTGGLSVARDGWEDDPRLQSSMLYWHPKIQKLNIPQPDTEIVEFPAGFLARLVSDCGVSLSGYVEEFARIMGLLGPFPIFLRTDQSSQKLSFKSTCRLPKPESLLGHMLELIHSNMGRGLEDRAIVFRRWLDLVSGFAAFGGLPISVEARAFTRDGTVTCVQPRWTEGSILRQAGGTKDAVLAGTPTHGHWREILSRQNERVAESIPILREFSEMAAGAVGGQYWCIDYALGRDGLWYLVDMEAGGPTDLLPGNARCVPRSGIKPEWTAVSGDVIPDVLA